MTEADLYDLIVARHPANEWAVFPQVRNAAGYDSNRTIDAIALNLWPSRGLALHGFEIKTGRGDWRRELRDPRKAEGTAMYCDYFWVVATKGVVDPGELPDGWGLYETHGKGLRLVHRAEKREAPDLTRSFVVALLKRASATSPQQRLAEAKQQGIEEGVRRQRERTAAAVVGRDSDVARWAEERREYEAIIGRGDQRFWLATAQEKAEAIRDVLSERADAHQGERAMEQLRKQAARVARSLGLTVEEVEA